MMIVNKEIIKVLLLIAGSGLYPEFIIQGARAAGIKTIVMVAINGETDPSLTEKVEETHWINVGQLGRLLKIAKASGANHSICGGQINPSHLFKLRPDFKALLMLVRLKHRNAETIFGKIAEELAIINVPLLPAYTFVENFLAPQNLIAGPKPSSRILEDIQYGYKIAKEISRLDIGQTVVVKKGTVLAVEGFDGTNETIKRGAKLGNHNVVVVKVAKNNQDERFDLPVIGSQTMLLSQEVGVSAVAIESNRTLLLEKNAVEKIANQAKITLWGINYAKN